MKKSALICLAALAVALALCGDAAAGGPRFVVGRGVSFGSRTVIGTGYGYGYGYSPVVVQQAPVIVTAVQPLTYAAPVPVVTAQPSVSYSVPLVSPTYNYAPALVVGSGYGYGTGYSYGGFGVSRFASRGVVIRR